MLRREIASIGCARAGESGEHENECGQTAAAADPFTCRRKRAGDNRHCDGSARFKSKPYDADERNEAGPRDSWRGGHNRSFKKDPPKRKSATGRTRESAQDRLGQLAGGGARGPTGGN